MSIVQPVNKISQATDYNLLEVGLYTQTSGSVDLKPFMLELSYYEDIYNCSVSGTLVLSEAYGAIRKNALTGGELLTISFVNATGGEPIQKVFNVFSISDRDFDIGNNYETYILNFCTEDLMISEKYRMSKSYTNKYIHDIAKDILDNKLKTGTSLDIENTYGSYDIIITNKKFFHAVNFLAMYALPQSDSSKADMLFFENNEGYKFKSLQTLYKQNSVYEYSYNPKNVNPSSIGLSRFESQRKNILVLEVLKNFDTLEGVSKGSFMNRTIVVDPLSRKRDYKDFSYENYKSSLNNNKVLEGNASQYIDRFGKRLWDSPPENFNPGAMKLMVTNNSIARNNEQYIKGKDNAVTKDFFVEKYLPTRLAQLSLSNYTKIKIVVPGNSDILAGTTLDINILSSDYSNIDESRKNDQYLSGKYLVTAVRHIINPSRYTTVVELAKDSKIRN